MKKSRIILITLGLTIFYSLTLMGGTLVYEDRSIKDKDPKKRLRRVSKVKIISISHGMVIIEKDGATRRIPLKILKEFYSTDITGGDSSDFDDNTATYTVNISDMDMNVPTKGYKKSKGKNKKRKTTTTFTINYQIVKRDKTRKTYRIRRPYFYLYIYTSGPNEYRDSNIFKFYYPKSAKVKNKVYNRAEIIKAVSSFKRSIINLNDQYNQGFHSSGLTAMTGKRRAKILMKGIKSRKILAYHLEVWGKNDIVFEKNWHATGVRLNKQWWIR